MLNVCLGLPQNHPILMREYFLTMPFLSTQQCSLGTPIKHRFGHEAHGEEHHLSKHMKVTRQSFYNHIKFVQLTLEQDFAKRAQLLFISSIGRIFKHQKLKRGPILRDQTPNGNDTATQEKH